MRQAPKGTGRTSVKKQSAEAEVTQVLAELKEQQEEFRPYLEKKITECPDNSFFRSMFKNIQEHNMLTENMIKALRKCQERDKEWEAKRAKEKEDHEHPVDENTIPNTTFKIRPWYAKKLELGSVVVTGKVISETPKAWFVKGYADIIAGTFCVRCGRQLTEVASQVIGMGAICAGKTGFPYPEHILEASKKERAKLRKQLERILHNQKFEAWLPKSQAEVLENKEQNGNIMRTKKE